MTTTSIRTSPNSSTDVSHGPRTIAVFSALVLATVALAALAVAVHGTLYFGLDLEIARAAQSYSADWWGQLIHGIGWLGFHPQVYVLCGLIFVLLYLTYSRWAALAFAVGAMGVGLTGVTLKIVVDRPRPSPELIHVVDPSLIGGGWGLGFPAGHAASFLVIFGFLGFLIYASWKSSLWRALTLTGLAALVVLVGYGRIYEGEHWFSDVVGGYLLGVIWLILTIFLYEWGKDRFLVQLTPSGLLPYPGPEGYLARWPALGLGLVVLGSLLFGALAVSVLTNGSLLVWDVPLSQALHARATHDFWLDSGAMVFVGALGRETALGITILLGLVWLWKRHWRELSLLLVGVVGGNIWFEVLSQLFGRHRPVFPDPLDVLPGPGFPSGHSMSAILLYGLILYLLLPRLPAWRWRLLAWVDAVLITLLIGYSRLYMGDHYLTDVLAGYAFGLAWGGLVCTAIEAYDHRRSAQPG